MYPALDLVLEHLNSEADRDVNLFRSAGIRFESSDYDELRECGWRSHPDYVKPTLRPYEFVRSIKYTSVDFWNRPSQKETYIYKSNVSWWLECELNSCCAKVFFGSDVENNEWIKAQNIAERSPDQTEYASLLSITAPFVTIDDYMIDGGGDPPLEPIIRLWSGGSESA